MDKCVYCLNAFVDDKLSHENDFSNLSIGIVEDNYRIGLTTGARRPTMIEFRGRINGRAEIIGFYVPAFCPECGRKLIENEKSRSLRRRK